MVRAALVAITFRTATEGGRRQPPDLKSGRYRPTVRLPAWPAEQHVGVVLEGGPAAPAFGTAVEACLTPIILSHLCDQLVSGVSFEIREGATIVGDGIIKAAFTGKFDHWLGRLVESLGSVSFATGFVQLRFSPRPTLNVYTPITVLIDGQERTSGEPDFVTALGGQVGKPVAVVTYEPGSSVSFHFRDQSVISFWTRAEDGKAKALAEVASDGSEWPEF